MNTVTIDFTKEEVTELINAVFARSDSRPGVEKQKIDYAIFEKLHEAYGSFRVEKKKGEKK